MHANFVDDRDIEDPALITEILTSLTPPSAELTTLTQSDATQARRRATAEAGGARGRGTRHEW